MMIVLATICCRFGNWGLVRKQNFCSDFENKVWSRFWSWSWGKIWSWSLVIFFCWSFVECYIQVETVDGVLEVFKSNGNLVSDTDSTLLITGLSPLQMLMGRRSGDHLSREKQRQNILSGRRAMTVSFSLEQRPSRIWKNMGGSIFTSKSWISGTHQLPFCLSDFDFVYYWGQLRGSDFHQVITHLTQKGPVLQACKYRVFL